METYSLLRQFADSWFLLAWVLFFVGVGVFALRPGSRAIHRAAAESIFRNETHPAPGQDMEKSDVR